MQGNPLSPMLFVMVMESLNSLIREADRRAALSLLPAHVIAHRASFYVDDLVFFVAPEPNDLNCLQQILQLFARASGLVTNVDKYVLTPIRCTEDMIQVAQQAFPGIVVPFPCKYLGIPLSIWKLRHTNEQALVDKVAARIPTWKSGLLTHVGRVLLIKAMLSVIRVHLSITCCLFSWAVEQIDKHCRAFLWDGTEKVMGGKCKVAWPTVYKPTVLGGLSVLDRRFFGISLYLHWEWLARVAGKGSLCLRWNSLPSKPEKKDLAMSSISMSVVVEDGESVLLWTDS